MRHAAVEPGEDRLDRFFPDGYWNTVVGDLFIVVMWITLFCGKRGIYFWLWFLATRMDSDAGGGGDCGGI